ncbi:MAG: hypothetical protein K2O88_09935 [Paramuribaculum sp.]|nr:hypothetical protein [Paramuribaculum sp.]
MRLRQLFFPLLALGLAANTVSCHKVDDDRTPYAPVYIPFTTAGDWDVYGVSGAMLSNSFIKSQRLPKGYPYTDLSQTGFGGVLLVSTYQSEPRAYDLSCPVECRRDILVSIDGDVAVCHTCGSTYDVFNVGAPLSGPAAQHHYGLTRYNVGNGANGVFRVITN